MDTIITARNVDVTDRFREYATDKASKVEALAPRTIALEVKLSRHRETRGSAGDDRIELTLIGPGPLVRAESSGSDKYVAFDLAFGKLVERIRQTKDRRKVHRGQHRPTSLREAAGGEFRAVGVVPADAAVLEAVRTGSIPVVEAAEAEADEEYCPVVIREKVFASTPMTVDDALYYMELVGHDFYLFIDRDTQRPSVVYRRKGWDYGVIALDGAAEELQEAVTALRAVR
ncbi:ribosome-associated translation inhibitor RaiA [Galbitalea sp. SE-J8]|uniref:ribosome hibernation-promoting factor, HPF/YfiA family n=1 Tax=Galbitalea sp. SE-J8 TaxID=3054952 RepID=UPI00259D08F9|nr:ribosome-associated translation inhibitor RaiA [Galbitalea sp. SE-J8]MDM4762701.1 ribosome-associated translation inhibitor RaiA [Galbitalea sp. SE-J8]